VAFDPGITQAEFDKFSLLVGQGIYATPVEPASARGLFSFDIGVGTTALRIDRNADYWAHAVGSDFSTGGYVLAPRVIVSKGLGVATVSASYAKVHDSSISIYGGSVDLPIIEGGLVKPTLSLRTSYSELRGIDVFHLKTYGGEVFLGKGFGPVTPYVAAGRTRTDSTGLVHHEGFPDVNLKHRSDQNRFTAGVRFSFLVTKIVVEATQGEDRSYAAKIAFGL
jgi:hypothetical protein